MACFWFPSNNVADINTLVEVSIHAPTRGATGIYSDHFHVDTRFQSTPPRGGGGDTGAVQATQGQRQVSIHAPTRGATGPTGRPRDR